MSFSNPLSIKGLLKTYLTQVTGTSRQVSRSYLDILKKTLSLFGKDYQNYSVIENKKEILCPTYPTVIPLPTRGVLSTQGGTRKLQQHFEASSKIRMRQRFAVPVFSYQDKLICRSSCVRSGSSVGNISNETFLLKQLGVTTIIDFMLKPIHPRPNLGIGLTELDLEFGNSYRDFSVNYFPFKGVQTLICFNKLGYDVSNLEYRIIEGSGYNRPSVNFEKYVKRNTPDVPSHMMHKRKISLVKLFQTYFQSCIDKLGNDKSNGLLIHCFSGWDRTPLFLSMIRLSLWADGLLHSDLSLEELCYFVISYDWYLYNHRLQRRLRSKSEILHFAFYFMQFLAGENYSLNKTPKNIRLKKFLDLYNHFFKNYSQILPLVKFNPSHKYNPPC
ncbi:myotubularin-related protein [Anaeramoeba flamelloides]|uniref:Myotubularin-related protein n=1 Tax=Anaeramoeba flamelloides TaxID=1746091 RepID=A0AAV7Z5Y5_9EUKA|nr:myotubularin-related protein [Anaeramoeba flamelloides]KAJ6244645.1 myotubularin-related protein [Anaeramoeba flamelloides]